MKNGNHDNLLVFEVASPEELKINLKAFCERKEKSRGRSAVLSLRGPKVMVCPFHLKGVAVKDLGLHLLGEAVEVMSLTSDEIELDYQIIRSDDQDVRGVYLCIAKAEMEDYLNVLDENRLNPVKITAQFLACLEAFSLQESANKGRVCFLDFSKEKTVNLFITNNQSCELLRKISYEDLDEAKAEIVQSLRSASAQSWPKHYDQIYYLPGAVELNGMLTDLQMSFDVKAEKLTQTDGGQTIAGGRGHFTINLLKNHVLSRGQRRVFNGAVNGALAVVLGVCVLLFQAFQKTEKSIRQIKSSYSASDYQYALDLKKSVR